MKIGSLCAGYGGLEEGVRSALGGEVAWQSEIDPGACKILAHRYPGVPNIGDMTTVDWANVEPVDVICGGTPCQDLSAAGKRLGMRAGTRSGLWASMCDAIDIIRPGLVVWENVRGALSAGADSSVEPCPICVGDERDSHLRALGRVVGDLAELGYVGRWVGLRASDVGAPHGRFRVFVAAWPAEDTDLAASGERRLAAPGQAQGWWARADAGGRGGAPAGDADVAGLEGRRPGRRADERSTGPTGVVDWGTYEPAVRRWERRLGRPAPSPTEQGRTGARLSPAFVEWMMGLPAGWVTDVPGLTRNEQLKALGNGVVSQQCAAALRMMLPDAGWQVTA